MRQELTARAFPVVTFLLALCCPAYANPEAESLFRAGREAAKRGDTAEACSRFRESYRLDPALGTRLNLALCEEQSGRLADALSHFQALSIALRKDDPRSRLVVDHVNSLERRVPRLELYAPLPLPFAFRMEGADSALAQRAFDGPVPVNPGRYRFRILATGFEPREYEFSIVEGERRTMPVELGERIEAHTAPGAAAISREASRVPPNEGSPAARTAGTIALGAAGSALLVSLIAGFAAVRTNQTLEELCSPEHECPPSGMAAASSGKTAATVATVGFATSLVLAAGGVSLLLAAAPPGPALGGRAPSSAPAFHASVRGVIP